MRFLTPVVVGLALAGLTLLTAPSAHAHAVLVASDPVDGTRLSSSPDAVHLTFDEPVKLTPGAVQVVSESGARVSIGMVLRPGGTAIDLPLPPRLPRGSYTAMWRLISADTHEVSGSISFGVDQDALASPAQTAVSDPLGLAANVIRGAIYLGMILGIGLTAVCRLLWPSTLSLRATRSIMRAGWALLALATVAQFILAGPRSSGLSWAGVLGGAGLSLTADSFSGLVALAVIVLPSRHADRLDRWSLTAFACVAVLILTGEYQAWRQVSPVEALWSTGYGITLLAKLAAVPAMLGLAYLGRRRLLPATLRRSVPLEAAFGAVVLVLTTALVAQPPARTLYGPPVALRAPLADGRSAEIAVSSTRHGPIGIQLAVVDEHGGVVQPQTMSATLSSLDAGIASLPVRLAPGPADHWHSTYATAARAGTWTLQITVGFTPTDAVATATVFRVW